MKENVALMLELQELEITLKEVAIVHAGEQAEGLHKKVAALRAKLPREVLSRYDRLSKHGLAIVSVLNGMCLGCHLAIPQGDLNRIISSKVEPMCPHCGKFLKV